MNKKPFQFGDPSGFGIFVLIMFEPACPPVAIYVNPSLFEITTGSTVGSSEVKWDAFHVSRVAVRLSG